MIGWSYPYLGGPIPEKLGAGRNLRLGVLRPLLPRAVLLSDSENRSPWQPGFLVPCHTRGLRDIINGKGSALRTMLAPQLTAKDDGAGEIREEGPQPLGRPAPASCVPLTQLGGDLSIPNILQVCQVPPLWLVLCLLECQLLQAVAANHSVRY